ncbi:MAG: S8 family serine peptidase [Xanthomonadaceae bacterium]|jgi:subtilisin family serine protease|nr:S8 family serine peptidase [Xanthomonadaceae bacterium]
MPRAGRTLLAAALMAVLTPAAATDWRAKASPHLLDQAKSGAPLDVLLVLDGEPVLAYVDPRLPKAARGAAVVAQLQAAGADARAAVVRELAARGAPVRELWIANAVATRLGPADLAAIGALPAVVRIHADRPFRADMPRTESVQPKAAKAIEPSVARVRAPQAWALGARGQGVLVGAQDTGYQWDHPAVRDAYRGWNGSVASHAYHWHGAIRVDIDGGSIPACMPNATSPCDDNGHGTHTLGTVLGDDGGANQIGVAPDAQWIGCRNMDAGTGRPSTYIECFQFFLAPTDANGANPRPDLAPDIITNSWGCPVGPPPAGEDCALASFDATLSALRTAGILVVVAAGNGSPNCGSIATPPAISADVFTVGSTANADVLSSFSLVGPVAVDGSGRLKPDVVAPGSGVRSATPGNSYGIKSGTSMATPNVAGVAALLISANPALRGDVPALEAILRETAQPLNPPGLSCAPYAATDHPNPIYGWGRVDALAAVQRAIAEAPMFRNGFEPAP